jgi:hypothetical protein
VSTSDLDDYLNRKPIPTLRLTLSSGDQLVIRDEDRPFTEGLVLILPGARPDGPRLISVPNIVLVEPVSSAPPIGRRRR